MEGRVDRIEQADLLVSVRHTGTEIAQSLTALEEE